MLVDSHCHLDKIDLSPYNGDLGGALEAAKARGVEHFLCVGISLDSFPAMIEKTSSFDNVSCSCGVHPLYENIEGVQKELLELAQHERVVAIGETGLDYYYAKDTKDKQIVSFEHHLDVANQLKKPLIIHTRDAKEDTIAIMKNGHAEKVGGVLHCFTEDLDMAHQAMDLGFYISISGIVTFKNAKALQDVVRELPLERLLVETDSPYLAPIPYRGKSNQPAYVREVAEFIADLRGISLDELAEVTSKNFYDLFPLARS